MNERKTILDVKGLQTTFFTDDGEIPAVDNVDFHIREGEVLGIVGESGCGKSVTSLSIMGLVPSPPGKITNGEILFQDKDLTKLSEKEMRGIRGNDIAMIFQEPMTSLNPLFTIGNQLREAIKIHKKDWSKKQVQERAIEMMNLVGLPRPEGLMKEYPHQLSGGMRQRVMIAMALLCDPKVLIADEPTTALDVTIQSQILKLIKNLNERLNTAVLLITHDLGVVAETCERVVVMYAGKVVEEGPVHTIFNDPQHPYTKGLLESVPDMRFKKERLYSIPGNVPKPGAIKTGCKFAARCEFAFDRCTVENPELYQTAEDHQTRCFLFDPKEVQSHDRTVVKS
ncbi:MULTISPECIES: ABC transporter ATP-binding protein [Planococcus]|uniref:Peptide ABC transporter ATP-binding protein n=2 Tax=Planococcus TaxID=1372 RepID=A0ABM5WYB9_9BACL|nr:MULTISPECIES: ABC transporter ATP-binding protein [Planococcus]ALS79352.1 peptide ABC transporter ATP-binding protein [Planococcus kocurii]AQU78679.1 ABC transporter ATP-binding protein [Planococcus faecalis]KAA0955053.1 ABC transporter ATP-binding protein [Planococcus sp. ANT_H30]MDJ0332153.1 ABC transporter ATP-binding protein [Planococcus sp. S3-L1]OHX54500.1 peptide ABC transporter ATP-binding protein [Planococcus faecalis]